MPTNIKTLIFDLGQVIFPLNVQSMCEQFDLLGAENAALKFTQDDVKALWKRYDNNLDTATFRLEMKTLLKLPEATTDEQFDATWNTMIGTPPPDRFSALKTFRAQGFKVMLASNSNDIHYIHMMSKYREELAACFDGQYFSNVIKIAKPSAAYYQKILDDNQLVAEESLFFDDRKENVDGAIAVGIHAREFLVTRPMTEVTEIIKELQTNLQKASVAKEEKKEREEKINLSQYVAQGKSPISAPRKIESTAVPALSPKRNLNL